jgi:hypothetical protein
LGINITKVKGVVLKKESKIFDKNEYTTMKAFAEVIIPTGDDPFDDPGANETEVVDFIDQLLVNDKPQTGWNVRDYLKELNQSALKQHNKGFSELSIKNQIMIVKDFEKNSFKSFTWLRRFVMSGFYSNYRPLNYKGKASWETIGYLGPMTWPEMTRSMSNPAYDKEQQDKEAVQI